MAKLWEIRLVYRERAIVYTVGILISLSTSQYWETPIALALPLAMASWIVTCVFMQAWMNLIENWKDPRTSRLGVPNRVFEAILSIVGVAILIAATLRPSLNTGVWGWYFLLIAIEARLCERESRCRYRLRQARQGASDS